jgi:glutamate racemase
MKIGIFDSGIGGEAVAVELYKFFPTADFICVDDREHLPYGDRRAEEIIQLTDTAIQPLLWAKCDVIVIACNSATAAAIETLRDKYPTQIFVGLEPMVKPAAELTQSGVIAVCATPATLSSDRYLNLKNKYGSKTTIIEPDCSTWARMIEDSDVNEKLIENVINEVCDQGVDVIVLACTHYHWIRETIERIAATRATILTPTSAIARRVSALLPAS